MLEKREEKLDSPKAPFAPKAASGSRVPQIAPPHGQAYFGTRRAMHKGQDGANGFRAASGRLKRKSAVRENGAIKTGADNGAHGRASRAPIPQAKAFGRIPKNRPLGGFLDGIPPHRFEPRSVLENENSRGVCLGCKISGADNGARTRDPHLGKVVLYQLSHVRIYKWWAIQDLNL